MDTWIVEDWMGKRVWPGEAFESFDAARGRISEHADAVAADEAEYNGICEDLYAVQIPA